MNEFNFGLYLSDIIPILHEAQIKLSELSHKCLIVQKLGRYVT